MVETPTLRGIVLRDEEDTLIVQASVDEIRAFGLKHHEEIAIARLARALTGRISCGHPLYDAEGREVGIVTEWNVRHEPIEVTTTSDPMRVYVTGRRRATVILEAHQGTSLV